MSTRLGLCLVVVLGGAAAGCDGDPAGWGAAEGVPAISSLIATAVAPAGAGSAETYQFEAQFEDPDAGLAGGSCQLQSTGPEVQAGTVACLFDITALDRVVNGDFTVTDRDGHVSNALGFAIPARRPRPAAGSEVTGGTDVRGVAASLRPAQS